MKFFFKKRILVYVLRLQDDYFQNVRETRWWNFGKQKKSRFSLIFRWLLKELKKVAPKYVASRIRYGEKRCERNFYDSRKFVHREKKENNKRKGEKKEAIIVVKTNSCFFRPQSANCEKSRSSDLRARFAYFCASGRWNPFPYNDGIDPPYTHENDSIMYVRDKATADRGNPFKYFILLPRRIIALARNMFCRTFWRECTQIR